MRKLVPSTSLLPAPACCFYQLDHSVYIDNVYNIYLTNIIKSIDSLHVKWRNRQDSFLPSFNVREAYSEQTTPTQDTLALLRQTIPFIFSPGLQLRKLVYRVCLTRHLDFCLSFHSLFLNFPIQNLKSPRTWQGKWYSLPLYIFLHRFWSVDSSTQGYSSTGSYLLYLLHIY